ncbi:MAG TPA: HAMP domain-containing protein [Bacteroidetes bacterium]|nr:HAMP domain-containing protein [Bacteroidota bacterium]
MKILRSKYYLFLLLSVLSLVLGIELESHFAKQLYEHTIYGHFQKRISNREQKMLGIMEAVKEKIPGVGNRYNELLGASEKKKMRDEELALFLFRNDSLVFWTDNTISVNNKINHKQALVFLGNGWYICHALSDGDLTINGLVLVRKQYQYENKYLKPRFFHGAWLDPGYTVSTTPIENGIPVNSSNGDFLFSLVKTGSRTTGWLLNVFSAFFYFIAVIFFFISLISLFRVHPKKGRIFLPVVFLVLILLKYLMERWNIPASVYSLSLFSPYYFAYSNWIPSLGDFFILSVFVFFFLYLAWLVFPVKDFFHAKRILTGWAFMGIFISGLFFFGVTELLYQLILNSSIGFEPYKILSLNIYSFIGIISVGMLFMSFILFTDKILEPLVRLFAKTIIAILIASVIAFLIAVYLFGFHIHYPVLLTFLILLAALRIKQKSVYVSLLVITALTGLYTTWFIMDRSFEKEKQNMKLLAVNLGAEHDPVAELMMGDISGKIQNDPEMKFIMRKTSYTSRDLSNIVQYLTMRFFKGYWNKYYLSVYLCTPEMGLEVNEEQLTSCFDFFRDLIKFSGTPIRDTRFYYLDNQNGQISYFGAFYYPSIVPGDSNGLFLQLDSKLMYEQLGYPELLLNSATSRELKPGIYSYAKYYNGNLVTQNGDYQYCLTNKMFARDTNSFSFLRMDDYLHLVYHENSPVMVILSMPVRHFKDYLVSFSYFFIFFFLLFAITFCRSVFPVSIQLCPRLLKQKIQWWMISLLFFTLVLIGTGSVLFNIRQFRENHYKNLSEKVLSVYVEMEHKLSYETSLNKSWSSPQYASLNDLLVKFSNVFYSDINLYDTVGRLLATSRPEIFEKELTGNYMNEDAFYQLSVLKKSELIQKESLGDLRYLSAYMPFLNNEGHLLAYLNLPYFTKQYVLTREVSNMIVGIVNYMVVMILIAIVLAVIVSDKITTPLRAIQERIGRFRLGKEYEHIVYKGSDEIASLVNAYNRMIDELARNVELLAKSERESAWREMARQIAHEIKNPLTPMKLSVQQLQRAREDKADDFDIRFKKLTQTLIEQIDRLSYIASAFSNFARLPRMRNEPVDIVRLLQDTIYLFRAQHEIEFVLQTPDVNKLWVFSDKDLLESVFTNLLKNAIQSLLGRKDGKIEVIVEKKSADNNVRVLVRDNGEGIPEGQEDKLFEPNFTTKSSGMGMGLAIVKKYVEDTGGRVWFEPNKEQGTTFIVELPLYVPDSE